ncbi:hypothetical protein C5D65_03655 [Rathayibacter toxicus]|nr:hypothetical protein C5D17_03640 [Rathayibacter toxicus]PPH60986.1 hypothetical protein C5C93_03690 [Rathayibacter toxicus]PPI33120.1 hypothetical protein C5D65_03655 [Rathayibacter toxicus]
MSQRASSVGIAGVVEAMTNTTVKPNPFRRLGHLALCSAVALSVTSVAACANTFSPSSAPSPNQKIMLVGDSIAQTEAPALNAALTAAGRRWLT